MTLSDLFLNRFLYKDTSQSSETADPEFVAADSTTPDPTPISSGGAAQDINISNVTLNGTQITPGSIPPDVLDVSNWGWSQSCAFSSTSATVVSWGAGTFLSAGSISYSISAGNTGTMTLKTYIYLDLTVSKTAYQHTTTPGDSVGVGRVLIAVANPGATAATFNLSEATQIVGDNILANTIDASKMNVGQLSAITANLGAITAGSLDAVTITGSVITGTVLQTAAVGYNVNITRDVIELRNGSTITSSWNGSSSYPDFNCYSIYGSYIEAGTQLTTDRISTNGLVFSGYISSSFTPSSSLTYTLGTASRMWAQIYCYDVYKSNDGGWGFSSFDEGVELQDGSKVSDVEAFLRLEPDKSRPKSKHGTYVIKTSTLPKAVHRAAESEDETDSEDVFAMMSIMIGAIRELGQRIVKLENDKQ